MKRLIAFMIIVVFLTTACNFSIDNNDPDVKNWNLLTTSAKGTTVSIAVDHSNPLVITWLKEDFASYLKTEYQMDVKIIDQPLAKTLDELNQDKVGEVEMGIYDIILFENEGFKTAFEKGLLYGPFSDKLKDVTANLDTAAIDYVSHEGIATQNYMVPYGRKQLSFIYNQDVFYDTPVDYSAFLDILKEYKGQFTYPDPRKSLEGEAFVLSVVGQNLDLEPFLQGEINQSAFIAAILPGINQLKEMEPYLKDQGAKYPASTVEMDDLFINGALMMSMAMNYNYATERLKEYEYPEGAATFVIPSGVATYTEIAGIAFNSANKSGAMVALNALISPAMQASKYDPKAWGSLPVYVADITPDSALDAFKSVKVKSTTVKAKDFIDAAMPEFSPALIKIVIAEWEKQVLNGN